MTALFYTVGSSMFLVGSIPYLFHTLSDEDIIKIDTYLGGIFIAGSICFTVGGVINFYRSKVGQKLLREEKSKRGLLQLDRSLLDGENRTDDTSQIF